MVRATTPAMAPPALISIPVRGAVRWYVGSGSSSWWRGTGFAQRHQGVRSAACSPKAAATRFRNDHVASPATGITRITPAMPMPFRP